MTLPNKKPGVASTRPKLPTGSSLEPDSSLISATPQELVARARAAFRRIIDGPLLTGQAGTAALDFTQGSRGVRRALPCQG
jgi:hypothetical protein